MLYGPSLHQNCYFEVRKSPFSGCNVMLFDLTKKGKDVITKTLRYSMSVLVACMALLQIPSRGKKSKADK